MALVATLVSTEEGGAPTARLRHHETENGGGDTHVSECFKSTIPIFWRSVQNCTVVGKSLKRVVGNTRFEGAPPPENRANPKVLQPNRTPLQKSLRDY